MSLLGFDIGSLYVKVYGEGIEFSYPAVTASPPSYEVEGLPENDPLKKLAITYQDKVYYLGERAYNTSNVRPNFTGDKNNTAGLLHFMASMAFCNQLHPDIVAGLAIEDFEGLKDITKATLSKEHKFIFNGKNKTLKANSVRVLPQGAAAYFDYILKGEVVGADDIIPERMEQNVLVVDIGYRTVDIAVLSRGKFDNNKTASMYNGVAIIYEHIRKGLLSRYNIRKNPADIDRIVREGNIHLIGKEIDISDIIFEASENIANSIIEQIRLTVPDHREIDVILLAGGGSYLTKNIFKQVYPLAEINKPEFANARGYWKYGRLKANE